MSAVRNAIIGYFLLFTIGALAQGDDHFPLDQVLDSVRLREYPSDSFALYLPPDFDPARPSPALFVFDPLGRGRIGVETFREAAAVHSWIVICSNNSRNGPYQRNFEVADRFFADAFARFSIDQRHIFLAGFSGGARLATTLAVLSGQIRGVIACGAAFSPNPGQMPSPGSSFLFAGIVGTRDMNYQELFKAETWLKKIKQPYRIFNFDGGHLWPPPDQIIRAVNWLALHSGTLPEDSPQREKAYQTEKTIADTLYAAGRLVESAREYRSQIDLFSTGLNAGNARERFAEIESSKEYARQLRVFEAVEVLENKLWNRFWDRFQSDLRRDPPPENFDWWKRETGKLHSKYLASDLIEERNMVARLENRIFAMAIETADEYKRSETQLAYLYCARLLTAVFPENAYAQIRLAEAYGLMKKPEDLIRALIRAKELGWQQEHFILQNRLIAPYTGHPDFPFRPGGSQP